MYLFKLKKTINHLILILKDGKNKSSFKLFKKPIKHLVIKLKYIS
jgi:hypothetical protein